MSDPRLEKEARARSALGLFMKLISNLQADRLITQIQSEPDPSSPAAKKALEKLKKLGEPGIPRTLQALAKANKSQTVDVSVR